MKTNDLELFSPEAVEGIKHYVYRLLDPRDGETFFVGVGVKNKVFEHAQGIAEGDPESNKLFQIRDILEDGLQVLRIIHSFGLSEHTAFIVATALETVYAIGGGDGRRKGIYHYTEVNNLFSNYNQFRSDNDDFLNSKSEISERTSSPEICDSIHSILKSIEVVFENRDIIEQNALECGFKKIGLHMYLMSSADFKISDLGTDLTSLFSILASENLKKRKNIAVLLAGVEIEEFIFRLFCSKASLSREIIRAGLIDTKKLPYLVDAAQKLIDQSINLSKISLLSVESIRSECHKLNEKEYVSFIIVYHDFSNLRLSDKKSRASMLKKYFLELKKLSDELKITFIYAWENCLLSN